MEFELHIDTDHWLAEARRLPSENQGARPDPDDVSLVVVHGISLPPGEFGTGLVERLFLNELDSSAHPALADLEGVRVSAHLLIARGGSLTQFVPFHRRAWHAGVSSFAGRDGCNDYAVGIELEGTDDLPYEEAQYLALTEVLAALFTAYPQLSISRLAGHAEVAPGRKTDPGPAFDWRRLFSSLAAAPPRDA